MGTRGCKHSTRHTPLISLLIQNYALLIPTNYDLHVYSQSQEVNKIVIYFLVSKEVEYSQSQQVNKIVIYFMVSKEVEVGSSIKWKYESNMITYYNWKYEKQYDYLL